jgi:hypothetical protein
MINDYPDHEIRDHLGGVRLRCGMLLGPGYLIPSVHDGADPGSGRT